MDIRDYVTPKTVATVLGLLLIAAVLSIFFVPENYQSTVWNGYIDVIAIASLLVTLTILSDLEELQERYLLRATIDDLQNSLKQRTENLIELLRSGYEDSQREISRELSKEAGILKRLADRTETVAPDTHEYVKDLQQDIQAYTSREDTGKEKAYDIWRSTHTLNELVKGLIEESKWKR